MDINEIGSKVFEGKIVRKDLVSKIKEEQMFLSMF